MRCAVVVPAYRAARELSALLPRLLSWVPPEDVLVVDDGSNDETAEVARAAGVHEVLRHHENLGKGSALMTGFVHAAELGFTHAICLDADGQHPPEEIPRFLQALGTPHVGVVVGARNLSPRVMPWPRVCSNRLTTFLLGLQAGTALFDSQCGFRLYNLEAVLHPSVPRQGRFEWESEALVRIARHGWAITSVPVPTIYGEALSHIHPWRDTGRFISMWFRLWREIPAMGREACL